MKGKQITCKLVIREIEMANWGFQSAQYSIDNFIIQLKTNTPNGNNTTFRPTFQQLDNNFPCVERDSDLHIQINSF